MKQLDIALVTGDGAAPEMMAVACRVAIEASKKDGVILDFVQTPMGWNAYRIYGDTLPPDSLQQAIDIGTVFFGGVGDPQYDNTIGVEHPEMKPESRALLALRKEMGLLLNFRPMVYYPELASLTNIKPDNLPSDKIIKQIWIRYLLEDSYFGNVEFLSEPGVGEIVSGLGVKLKKDVTGQEDLMVDLAFYRRETIEKYIRVAFKYAREQGLPLISIDKANVMSRYDYWRKIVTRIWKEEFSDVSLVHQLVDSANALLFTPASLHGVIACGNEHGDILSDGAASALGSMGMMCSSSINPDNNAAMFESGAGTAPTIAGQNKANPLGRILTAAMMLRHLGLIDAADAIENSVKIVLQQGFRTVDLMSSSQAGTVLVGTREMGSLVSSSL